MSESEIVVVVPPHDRNAAVRLNAAALTAAVAQLDKVNLDVWEWPSLLRNLKIVLENAAGVARAQARALK